MKGPVIAPASLTGAYSAISRTRAARAICCWSFGSTLKQPPGNTQSIAIDCASVAGGLATNGPSGGPGVALPWPGNGELVPAPSGSSWPLTSEEASTLTGNSVTVSPGS